VANRVTPFPALIVDGSDLDLIFHHFLLKAIADSNDYPGIDVAQTGKIAKEKVARRPYRLIFIDLHISPMNGVELIVNRRLEEEEERQHAIIVGMTGRSRVPKAT
jgi:DNA-binding response OmpR family regulator